MGKIFNIFSDDWAIWGHYILLVGILFLGFYIGQAYFNLSNLSTMKMFIYWFVVISIGDQLIHYWLSKILRRRVD